MKKENGKIYNNNSYQDIFLHKLLFYCPQLLFKISSKLPPFNKCKTASTEQNKKVMPFPTRKNKLIETIVIAIIIQ